MKTIKFLRTLAFAVLMGASMSVVSSCGDDESTNSVGRGTVSGVVTDDAGMPIAGVTVAVTGMDETASTGADGTYSIANVSMETHAVVFSKAGWLTVSITVTAKKFDANRVATASVAMVNASAKITGTITDAKNNGVPLSGATVSIGTAAGTAVTGADGKFTIENLIEDDYTVTISKTDYVPVVKVIAKSSFVDGVATLNLRMGGKELLRDKTAEDLVDAAVLSDYNYGGNFGKYDWSYNAMTAQFDFYGDVEHQGEGTALRIRNSDTDRGNPADEEMFDTYMYGRKKITAQSKILTISVRTHQGTEDAPAHFGVRVADLEASTSTLIRNDTHFGDQYKDFSYDLSAYVGKEVVVAIGTYRWATGDYWKQLPVRRITFAPAATEGLNPVFAGTEVVEGWKLTKETLPNISLNAVKSFTGITPRTDGNNTDKFRSWASVNHLAKLWSFACVNKDVEPFASEGYIIKTRGGGTTVNTEVPESFLYTKFAIAAGSNQLTVKTRNFGSNYTFFKLSAIKDDGTVIHLNPASNTAQDASAAANGCWKFKHGEGGADEPTKYASFVYDLSQFNGSNVVITIGVYKGEDNGDESKLVLYSIDLK